VAPAAPAHPVQAAAPAETQAAAAPPAQSEPTPAPAATARATAAAAQATPAISLPAEARMSSADRRQVQEALRRLNYYHGPVDGIIGPQTRQAIRDFQQHVGAQGTGYLSAAQADRLVAAH
jgi:peptidoglycan hydrolase-like protein with peptidoglycan-binding domain